MDNFQERITITMSNKTRTAMLTFLQKYGGGNEDVSAFIEEAITWRILERQAAVRKFLAENAGEEAGDKKDDPGALLTA